MLPGLLCDPRWDSWWFYSKLRGEEREARVQELYRMGWSRVEIEVVELLRGEASRQDIPLDQVEGFH